MYIVCMIQYILQEEDVHAVQSTNVNQVRTSTEMKVDVDVHPPPTPVSAYNIFIHTDKTQFY